MAELDNDPSRNLTGVVIITLPPPDNPSLGKTITAYTISDDDSAPNPPPNSAQNPQTQTHLLPVSRRLVYGTQRTLLPIICVSLIALYVWVSVSSETRFVLREPMGNDDDDSGRRKNESETERTFVFPLYKKEFRYEGIGGVEGSVLKEGELKLGRFVGFDSSSQRRGRVDGRSVSAASMIDDTRVVPVRGNIYPDGLYYTYLHFGNPPRPYFLDMDTGSDLTWIQCDAPCTSCAKGAHPFYKPLKANLIPSRDSLCVEVQRNQVPNSCESCHQCDYEIEYADHSSSMGVLAKDELFLNIANGSIVNSKVVFGCAYDQQGLLLNTLVKTDGILGLSRASVSLPSQLASKGIIKNVLGHCLATDATGGGYLFLGDDFVPYRQMAWVPMLHGSSLNSYQTEMVKMSYGSRQMRLGSAGKGQGRVVFDTGSSYSYFTEQAYNDLVSQLNDVSNENFVRDMSDTSLPLCWRAKSSVRSVKDVKQWFKPLNLQFGSKWWIVSTKLQIPPEGYLVINSKGNVCLGILNGKQVHDGSTFILGDVSLRGLLFVYDNVKEKIGWIRSDCARPPRFEGTWTCFMSKRSHFRRNMSLHEETGRVLKKRKQKGKNSKKQHHTALPNIVMGSQTARKKDYI